MNRVGWWRLFVPCPRDGQLLFVGEEEGIELLEVARSVKRLFYADARGGRVAAVQKLFSRETEDDRLYPLRMERVSKLPLADGTLDAVVLGAGWSQVFVPSPWSVLEEVSRLLGDGGSLFVPVRPRWPVVDRSAKGFEELWPASVLGTRTLRRFGFTGARVFSVVTDSLGGRHVVRLGDEATGSRFRSIYPESDFKTRLKRGLGRRGRGPGFLLGLLTRGEVDREPFRKIVEEIVNSLDRGGLGLGGDGHLWVSGSENLAFPGVRLGSECRVEVANRVRTREREGRNADLLEELHSWEETDPARGNSREGSRFPIPRVWARGRVAEFPYTVEETLPGVTLLDFLRRGANGAEKSVEVREVLGKIGSRLGHWQRDGARFEDQDGVRDRELSLGRRLDALARLVRQTRDSRGEDLLEECRAWILQAMETEGNGLPIVRGHGDFGPQNLLVDSRSGELTGVLDWDLTERSGFPLIDVAHLSVALEWKLTSKRLPEALISTLFGGAADWKRRPEVAGYLREMPVPDSVFPLLHVLTWVDWVSPHAESARARDVEWIREHVSGMLGVVRSAGAGIAATGKKPQEEGS